MSARSTQWASTCYPATATPTTVARWQRASSAASCPTTTSGRRWKMEAKNLKIQEFLKWDDVLIFFPPGLRSWSVAFRPPWWSKMICASRSFSNVALWTWWVRWRKRVWTGISCELWYFILFLPTYQLVYYSLLPFFSQLHRSEEDAGGSPGEGCSSYTQFSGGRLFLLDFRLHDIIGRRGKAFERRTTEEDVASGWVSPHHVQ